MPRWTSSNGRGAPLPGRIPVGAAPGNGVSAVELSARETQARTQSVRVSVDRSNI